MRATAPLGSPAAQELSARHTTQNNNAHSSVRFEPWRLAEPHDSRKDTRPGLETPFP